MGCWEADPLNYFWRQTSEPAGRGADITCFGQRSATLPPSHNPRPEYPDVKTSLGVLYTKIIFLCHLWEGEILI